MVAEIDVSERNKARLAGYESRTQGALIVVALALGSVPFSTGGIATRRQHS